MQFLIEAAPIELVLFARECVDEFISSEDSEKLVIARRAMLRLSKHVDGPGYWIDRFTEQLQELELSALVEGHMPDIRSECHKTLDELQAAIVIRRIAHTCRTTGRRNIVP